MIRKIAWLLALAICGCASRVGTSPDVASVPVTERIVTGTGGAISIATSATTVGVSSDVGAPPNDVVAALRAVYEGLQLPVTELSGGELGVGNGSFRVRRRLGGVPMQQYVDCGGSPGQPNAETFDIVLSVVSYVTPRANAPTTLTTRTSALGSDPKYGAGNQLRCSSTGELEQRIGRLVRERLGLR